MTEGYRFRSSLFAVEPGENEEVNPGIYGRQLAKWLKSKLEEKGYPLEPIIAEDWGRCLMCRREPFMLWVGVGNEQDGDAAGEGEDPPEKGDIVWRVFPEAELPLLRRLFGKIDTRPDLEKLDSDLESILRDEPGIEIL